MYKRLASGLLSCLLICIITVSFVPFRAHCETYTVGETEALADGIIDFKLSSAGTGNIQDWINVYLTDCAGNGSEWYIVGLAQSGKWDFSSYEKALLSYLGSGKVISATSMEKYALALSAVGSSDKYITYALENAVGEQGIMSLIYGLHVLNNGHTCGKCSVSSVTKELLGLQYDDGGWALFGGRGDIDVTAMTVQALAPQYKSDSSVKSSVDKALAFLSERQESDGNYRSFGDVNPESAAQVLVALSALGIDCQTDSRFIKGGNSIIDAISHFRLADGSFSHTDGGASNSTATVQAYYSLVSYSRMKHGKSPLLVLDSCKPLRSDNPAEQPTQAIPQPTAPVQQQQAPTSAVQPGSQPVPVQPGSPSTQTPTSVSSVTPAQSGETAPELPQDSGTVTSAVTSTAAPASGQTVSGSPSASQTTVSSQTTTSGTTTVPSSNTVSSSISTTSGEADSTATGNVISPANEEGSGSSKGSYKPIVIAIISGTAVLLCGVIFIIGKRNYKNFIAVGIAAAAGIIFVLVTDFQSTDSYYNGQHKHKDNAIGTVTLSIRCDTIAGKGDPKYVPEDGIVLDTTEFDIEEGETVYDILTEAARAYRIQVENKGSSGSAHGMVYIAGINYIYEMQFGDLSGWVYHVNGITPSRSCGEYVLSDGDVIEWLYTTELGHDLNEVYEK